MESVRPPHRLSSDEVSNYKRALEPKEIKRTQLTKESTLQFSSYPDWDRFLRIRVPRHLHYRNPEREDR
jgi:hypothetical protein